MATQPIHDSEDHRELVPIFETNQDSEALVIQGLLDSAGIKSLVSGEVGPQDVLPMGNVIVRVAAESAEQARALIEDYRSGNEAEVIDQNRSDQSDETPSA